MKERREFIWLITNLLLMTLCLLRPGVLGCSKPDEFSLGLLICCVAWYVAGFIDIAIPKRK